MVDMMDATISGVRRYKFKNITKIYGLYCVNEAK